MLEDGTIKYSALTNDQVCRELKLPSLSVAMRCARLKFLQSMVAQPAHHQMFWSAMVSPFCFESQTRLINPWTDQSCHDVMAFGQVDDAHSVSCVMHQEYAEKKDLALSIFYT